MRKLKAQVLKQQDRFAPISLSTRVLSPQQPISPAGPNLRSILSALVAMYRIPSVHPLSTSNGSVRRDRLARY